MPLSKFVQRLNAESSTLILANRVASNQPFVDVVDGMFDGQPVTVTVEDIPTEPADHLVVRRDGELVASSSVNEFLDSVLLTDASMFTSEGRSLGEIEVPDVVEALAETRFTMTGSSEETRGKLLFVAMSRLIEKRAAESAGGTLRSGFQWLSRLDDEPGTAAAYSQLAASPVDVHVYGSADTTLPADLDVTVHSGDTPAYRDNWFVVFEPAEESSATGMALVATRTGPREWEGFWTEDPDLVAEIAGTIHSDL